MICLISLKKNSDVLPAFTCARAIGNLWSNYLGVNIFRLFHVLYHIQLCVPFENNHYKIY